MKVERKAWLSLQCVCVLCVCVLGWDPAAAFQEGGSRSETLFHVLCVCAAKIMGSNALVSCAETHCSVRNGPEADRGDTTRSSPCR